MTRHIMRAATIRIGGEATELWLGFESSEPNDLADSEAIVTADGMTDDELALVERWVQL